VSDDDNRREVEREIVIVRRGGDDEGDGHHGGVWKIAYADFMTAMMAFFLVMWLVNAANEETKSAVASYFNPIKLLDEKPADRSIQDQGQASEGITDQPAADTQGQGTTDGASEELGRDQNATAGEETQYSESDFFDNPYAVLAEIALETGQQANISAAGEGGAQTSGPATGASGGEAYRDPFDPDFWSQQTQSEEQLDPVEAAQPAAADTLPQDDRPEAEDEREMAMAPAGDPAPLEDEGSAEPSVAQMPADETAEAAVADADATEPADDAETMARAEAQADANDLREDLQNALTGINGKLAEGLDVTPAEGGLLISLTDQLDYGMFNIGSAIPKRDLVLAMEEIGSALSGRDGVVVIRGHTDARPFQSGESDNWRLSTDRAHSAYYMLVRGGLAEDRVVQVSGFADRKLRVPEDPYSDANRRIEILVQAGAGG
jgi:chemotaxis protein MotB